MNPESPENKYKSAHDKAKAKLQSFASSERLNKDQSGVFKYYNVKPNDPKNEPNSLRKSTSLFKSSYDKRTLQDGRILDMGIMRD